METNNSILRGICDICTKPDGVLENMNLQRCRECGVHVHEVCYGMVDTGTSKDPNFVCHACARKGRVVEVNVPSKVGGPTLRDLVGGGDADGGMASFREFVCERRRGLGDEDAQRKIDFYFAAGDYKDAKGKGGGSSSMKDLAHRIYDEFFSNDAPRRITDLPSSILSWIESRMFKDELLSHDAFDKARIEALSSLELRLFDEYRRSSQYSSLLSSRRVTMTQDDRPAKCELCSVRAEGHAMHPLYDMAGKEGRQLVLPQAGRAGPRRLAWVHTLCAMFLSAHESYGGLVYGCNEDGEFEAMSSDEGEDDDDDDDDDEDDGDDGDDGDDDGEDDPAARLLKKEQTEFAKCEEVFVPLMVQLDKLEMIAKESSDSRLAYVSDVLSCIRLFIEFVQYMTPPFIETYGIGKVVKRVKKTFTETDQQVRLECKELSEKMERVYNTKKENVPDGFVPSKADTDKTIDTDNFLQEGEDGAEDTNQQKYKIGMAFSKTFRTGTFIGKIFSYDATRGMYKVVYTDFDREDLDEEEISNLLPSHTAWFCMAPCQKVDGKETKESEKIRKLRNLPACVICKHEDKHNTLRIPVQCTAGDKCEYKTFKQFHRKLNKDKELARKKHEKFEGCGQTMHIGCARWGNDKYAKLNGKNLRMCYYFSGKPPTYVGNSELTNPVANCFCRVHAREIQEGLHKGGGNVTNDSTVNDMEEEESDDSAKEARRIAKMKKRKRILTESDEESD